MPPARRGKDCLIVAFRHPDAPEYIGGGIAPGITSEPSHAPAIVCAMTDNEIKTLAKLLQPYRDQVEEFWGRRRTGTQATSSPTELLTIPETAAVLGYKDRGTVYDLISTGALRAVDVRATGKQAKTRVRRDDLQSFIDSRTRRAAR